jgi:hypothetical protein
MSYGPSLPDLLRRAATYGNNNAHARLPRRGPGPQLQTLEEERMSDTSLPLPATTSLTPRAPAARRGSGHLYLRGRTYWMKFYVGGRPVYESTHQTKRRSRNAC